MTPVTALRPYQVTARDVMLARERAILGDPPGVGKTPVALVALDHGGAVDAGRARIDLWVFQQYLNVCPPATFTYRAECARETIAVTRR